MAFSLSKPRTSTPLNSLAPRMAKASIDVNRSQPSGEPETSDEVVSMVFDAIAATGMSDKEAAYTMAMDPAALSRIKTRQQRMSIDAMWRLPDAFWFEFRKRVDEARGLSDQANRDAKVNRIAELLKLLLEVA
jgi:ribosome-binding protein aMBF1 (putative translation factor)